ncbi:MAG: hypothetical protein KDE09_03635 [Anaerolineales bacterium]|nr:hypothetical protein [Anaerolineales bacterium]MCB0006402.1 hypothetical protein [Anaerolineales bacterium]MCB0013117.1 hypothetical protein [Anaerolineales bacterium]MCB0016854.1 hypothetical protein [Anaerolineales bacterium]MCB8962277.1 hypothetical protein [Ardenticatenales bacterium]
MSSARQARILFFSLLAGLMLAELLFRNAGALLFNLEGSAAELGLSPGSQQIRLFLLILLDGIAGGGAILAALAYWRREYADLGRVGVYLATGGLIAHGTYQFLVGAFQVADSGRIILFIGIFYFLLGIATTRAGDRLLGSKRRR